MWLAHAGTLCAMNFGVVAVSAVVGLVLGDAMELFVDRVPERRALNRPWWRCRSCGRPATGLGLVPVLRVLALPAECPSCGHVRAHPWRPAVMALCAAVLLAGFAIRIGTAPELAAYGVFGLGLLAITAVDVEHRIVPVRLLYPTLIPMMMMLAYASWLDHRWTALLVAAVSGLGAFLAFFAIHLVQPQGMGFGDVRLAGLVGLGVAWLGDGWRGAGFAALALGVAFLLGALVGVGLMIVKGAGRKTAVPFAPFLAAGAVIVVLWGNPLVDFYLRLRG